MERKKCRGETGCTPTFQHSPAAGRNDGLTPAPAQTTRVPVPANRGSRPPGVVTVHPLWQAHARRRTCLSFRTYVVEWFASAQSVQRASMPGQI